MICGICGNKFRVDEEEKIFALAPGRINDDSVVAFMLNICLHIECYLGLCYTYKSTQIF